MKNIRLATLFSGIGSPEQGASRVYEEVETVFACEFDKFARQSYKAIYDIDDEHFHKDVNGMDATQYRDKVDILIGGSPCQSFSIAGLRKGTDEQRGQLIYQYIRVVDECRPEVIIYENVKGIMSIDNGNTIKEFVQALRDIGYYCHYEVVNTKHYGVPQSRERLFLVGFLDHEVYHRFTMAERIPLTKKLKDVLEDDVDEKYYLSDKALIGYKTHTDRMQERGNGFKFEPTEGNCIASSITTRAGSRPDDNFIKVPSATKQEPKIVASRGRNKDNPSDRTPGAEVEQRLEVNENGTSNAITTVQKDNYVLEPSFRIRKLTTKEVWRLQDFPDEAHDKAKEIGVSNSQLYKQAGNSMSVNILEMIFRQIEKANIGESGGLF